MMRSTSKSSKPVLVLLVATLWLSATAVAQQPPSDLTGSWDFETSLTLGSPPEVRVATVCDFLGTANIVQDGGALSGNASMMLVNGGGGCPSEASASLAGSVDGPQVMLQLDGGNLGLADLGGEFIGGLTYAGGISVQTGPFASSGTWSAERSAELSIPTLGFVGATVLTLLLASASLVMLRARSNA